MGFLTPPVLSEGGAWSAAEDGGGDGLEWREGEERELCWELAQGFSVAWRVRFLAQRRLLLLLKPGLLPDGSKECFVRLLEWAEEEAGAEEVLLLLPKARRDLQTTLKTFAFFGFSILPPDKTALIAPAADSLAMVYQI